MGDGVQVITKFVCFLAKLAKHDTSVVGKLFSLDMSQPL